MEEAYDDNNKSDTIINLKNINMPFLNIVAKKDDLVAPSSSKALNKALTECHDKATRNMILSNFWNCVKI